MVRHLRMQSYNDIFAGDPTWVTESLGGRLNDGRDVYKRQDTQHAIP